MSGQRNKPQNKINYQKELEKILAQNEKQGLVPTLLLHSCCAPCSSYVLEYLSQYFKITVFYYNPNIYPEDEYAKRVQEQSRLIEALNREAEFGEAESEEAKSGEAESEAAESGQAQSDAGKYHPIQFLEGTFNPKEFYQSVKGLEHIPEGGERCHACFRLRLERTAREAKQRGFDYFTTTLTISPLKNAEKLNEIGAEIGAALGISWLPSDFKKKNGYKRSTELSARYGLYRQDYCGCVFSRQERAQKEG